MRSYSGTRWMSGNRSWDERQHEPLMCPGPASCRPCCSVACCPSFKGGPQPARAPPCCLQSLKKPGWTPPNWVFPAGGGCRPACACSLPLTRPWQAPAAPCRTRLSSGPRQPAAHTHHTLAVWIPLKLLQSVALWLVWRSGADRQQLAAPLALFGLHLFLGNWWNVSAGAEPTLPAPPLPPPPPPLKPQAPPPPFCSFLALAGCALGAAHATGCCSTLHCTCRVPTAPAHPPVVSAGRLLWAAQAGGEPGLDGRLLGLHRRLHRRILAGEYASGVVRGRCRCACVLTHRLDWSPMPLRTADLHRGKAANALVLSPRSNHFAPGRARQTALPLCCWPPAGQPPGSAAVRPYPGAPAPRAPACSALQAQASASTI